MIWQPEFTDKTLSRKPGAVQTALLSCIKQAREDVLTLRHLQLLHQNR
ncbi:TPA: DUF957 domain-containing protein [Escherichia coli]|nr:DUF957 domain-containing protein [Escherichia coli]MBW9484006.1 DUF957 domain-containing protein [Escherichia coli]HBB9856118.1 DUF957 domain-containing protein [Escherichia coli]HBD3125455.1 DUF957 domain-containing protein [Escherichia coli]